ncbi:hypothetical protein OnM2_06428 [Erysiphe neolycopersici]|uniref:Uncharacterized protein n=1 Tax=Erysiphe neolycopersici TaxID=212602 RepID=A0A420HNS6_9PEZI|nr:hypothetical protein OnM2_06428 [Erysiphe neolycopersici]
MRVFAVVVAITLKEFVTGVFLWISGDFDSFFNRFILEVTKTIEVTEAQIISILLCIPFRSYIMLRFE